MTEDKEEEEEKEYISFWAKIVSSPGRSVHLVSLIMGFALFFTLLLKLLMMKRVNVGFTIANEIMILLIIFVSFIINHYTLHFATLWW